VTRQFALSCMGVLFKSSSQSRGKNPQRLQSYSNCGCQAFASATEPISKLAQPLHLTFIILQERRIRFINHPKTPPSSTQSSTAWRCSFRLLLPLQQQHPLHVALFLSLNTLPNYFSANIRWFRWCCWCRGFCGWHFLVYASTAFQLFVCISSHFRWPP